MTKKEIQEKLREKGLSTTGTKAELEKRLNTNKGSKKKVESKATSKAASIAYILKNEAHNMYRRQPRSLLRDEKVSELAKKIANL